VNDERYWEGRADAWQSAADMITRAIARGDSIEWVLASAKAIAANSRDRAER
jgi:hypothetical protein